MKIYGIMQKKEKSEKEKSQWDLSSATDEYLFILMTATVNEGLVELDIYF